MEPNPRVGGTRMFVAAELISCGDRKLFSDATSYGLGLKRRGNDTQLSDAAL